MNKKLLLALKILLPVLVVLLAALLFFQIKGGELHNDNENGLLIIIVFILNIIPMIAMAVLGVITAIAAILLWAIPKKVPVVVLALVVQCLLVPFVAFSFIIDVSALGSFIELPIIAVSLLAVNLACIVLCGIVIHQNKKIKKLACSDRNQVEEQAE